MCVNCHVDPRLLGAALERNTYFKLALLSSGGDTCSTLCLYAELSYCTMDMFLYDIGMIGTTSWYDTTNCRYCRTNSHFWEKIGNTLRKRFTRILLNYKVTYIFGIIVALWIQICFCYNVGNNLCILARGLPTLAFFKTMCCNTFRLFVRFLNPIRKRSPGNTNFGIREKR